MSDQENVASKNVETLFKFDTEYSADSVEWCPHEGFQNIFACANYHLEQGEKEDDTPCVRSGRILLFSISPKDGLNLLQTLNTAAVLDLKWCHTKINDRSLLGVVNAQKTIEIYQLIPSLLQLELLTSLKIADDKKETLLLSLDWATGKYDSQEPDIVVSDSKGHIHRLKLGDNRLVLEDSWNAHGFEAWISGFYYWDTNIVFTGGDDSLFCKFDKRCGSQPLIRNKSHEAGVTSFHSNAEAEYIVASGSYDENIRLWDIRKMKSPVNAVKMPGPLWRLKWDPFSHRYLLAACMLGGVHVVDSEDVTNLSIIGSYYEHKNIAYGADWCYSSNEEVKKFEKDGSVILGSCSFYDHLLCVSKLICDM